MKLKVELVKDLIEEKEITQRILADNVGISRTGLNLILNNHRQPRSRTIGKIAKALNVDKKLLIE